MWSSKSGEGLLSTFKAAVIYKDELSCVDKNENCSIQAKSIEVYCEESLGLLAPNWPPSLRDQPAAARPARHEIIKFPIEAAAAMELI